jgi:hypothetical protein
MTSGADYCAAGTTERHESRMSLHAESEEEKCDEHSETYA